jgi:quinol monooxygenase YgiN
LTVLLFERHPVDPSRSVDFERLVHDVLSRMRAAPGGLWADCARAFDDDPSFLLVSEWRSEADAEAWGASPDATGFERDSDAMRRADVTRRRFSAH